MRKSDCIRYSIWLLICAGILGCSGSNGEKILSAEERFALGKEYYDDGDFFEAIQQFDIVKLQYQGSSVSDKAQYYTGMARFQREEYRQAEYDFEILIRNYPSSALVPEAYYMIAQCYVELSPISQRDQTDTHRALDALQTFIELYPTHSKVPEARNTQTALIEKLAKKEYETGVLYEKLENDKAALIYFDRVLDQYYNTAYADDALLARIQVLLRRKRHAAALKSVAEFRKKFPDSPLMEQVDRLNNEIQGSESAGIPEGNNP